MSGEECEKCGRKDGHYIGCPAAVREHAKSIVGPDFAGSLCEHEGCNKPKREYSGKGPKPKYCADGHK